MSDSTRKRRKAATPAKPSPEFPLGIHKGSGYWCKKVRGKVYYFGKVADDPKGKAALELWREQKDDLLAGREPRLRTEEGLVVGDLCNQFLEAKLESRDNNELSPRTYATYYSTCAEVVSSFGRNRLVSDLTPADFRKLRTKLAKKRKLVALKNAIIRVRVLFKFAFDENLITAPIKFGQGFKLPRQEHIDAAREKKRALHGPQMFEAHEIRLMLDALEGKTVALNRTDNKTGKPVTVDHKANPQLRAMVLLAANCAFGQSDLSELPARAINESGWIDYGRGKTGVGRKIPLWPETVEAIKLAKVNRPKPKNKQDAGQLFLTCRGARFVRLNEKGHVIDGIGQEFNKLIEKLEIKRPRLGIYALRHGFETIAGETADQVAVGAIMGHKDRTMAAHYRERISDARLQRVVEYVRRWVFDLPSPE
jgi:integrase